ncbi:hypothetical protein PT156_05665 [Erysipelothrix rhusiopathiae]|nr:hypothetical protein [Erysipelothrix rhusiopathiae]MDE8059202.1 hypothetical protein [Erysipelothrix rhusiopathiae]MDE8067722.1 hypothetical protein [Erysipelothrix rhusiopathiae]MDE8077799.1 hypothetical protein [Erysipelothrix rhusiopathiae]MDE8082896.1 hypothetical protein [Erysipelothrix rhusiopathiae]
MIILEPKGEMLYLVKQIFDNLSIHVKNYSLYDTEYSDKYNLFTDVFDCWDKHIDALH